MAYAIFNRSLYKQNLARFYHKIERDDFLSQLSDELVQEIVDDIGIKFMDALIYSPANSSTIAINANITQGSLLLGSLLYDEEEITLPANSYDLIISSLSLHLVNDLPGALSKYYQALKPNGLFIATLLGGQSLLQLRNACMHADQEIYNGVFPRVMPCVDKAAASSLLQSAGFSIPTVSSDLLSVHYKHMADLLLDMRKIGHSNCLNARRQFLEKASYIPKLKQTYQQMFSGPEGLRCDFEILILTGSKD